MRIVQTIVLCLFAFFVSAQEVMEKTLVLKIKREFSQFTSGDKISHVEYLKSINNLGLCEVKRVFPRHSFQEDPTKVNLSLLYILKYSADIAPPTAAKWMEKYGIYEYVEPYIVPELCYTPNDPKISDQYYLTLIKAFDAWDVTKGSTSIVVGVTDTGWDPNHIDLQNNAYINSGDPVNGVDDDNDGYIDNWSGWDLGDDDNDPSWNGSTHGAHVSGLVAATPDNNEGIAGVGYNTKIMPIKISNTSGALTKAYQGIVYGVDNGCDIINCSWGSYGAGSFQKDVIKYAVVDNDVLVIGATGNGDKDELFYPAAYDGVLSVSASEQSDLKKNNSNFGYYVDISAPGEAMYSTLVTDAYGYNGGTSMAAPVVAGAAGLVKSVFSSYTSEQIAAQLKATADNINTLNPNYVDQLGFGRLNVYRALSEVSAKFLDLTSVTITDGGNETFVNGEQLQMQFALKNVLAPLQQVEVTVSVHSGSVTVLNGQVSLGDFSTLETKDNGTNLVTMDVLNSGGINEKVVLKLVCTSGAYSVNHYYTFIVNPDHLPLDVNQIKTSITSNGRIGYRDASNTQGLGFMYNGESLMYESGIMIGIDDTHVSDVIRGVSGQDSDFESIDVAKYMTISGWDQAIECSYSDNIADLPIGITVKQISKERINAPDDKYVLQHFFVKNTSLQLIDNIYVGLGTDWDIEVASENDGYIDESKRLAYTSYDKNGISVYAGTMALNASLGTQYYNIKNSPTNPVINISNDFNTAEKWQTLSQTYKVDEQQADIFQVISQGPFSLAANEEKELIFAYVVGDSKSDLLQQGDNANAIVNSVSETFANKSQWIYPSITASRITISSEIFKRGAKLEVMDSKGALVKVIRTMSPSLVVEDLVDGVYLLKYTVKNKKLVSHLIIKR